jgi:hypothetical protein
VNLFFADNFDTDSAGSLPSWLSVITGTWSVLSDASAYSAPNDLQNTSPTDGVRLLIKGGSGVSIPATADMTFAYVTKSLSNNNGLQPIIRSDATAQNYYVWLINNNGNFVQFILYKSVNGSLSTVYDAVTSQAWPRAGVALRVKVAAVGTTISAKCWLDANSEPGSYQASTTDSSITAAGYAGFYNAGSSQYSVDNLTLFGNSSLSAGTVTSSGITSSTATLTSTAATGGTSPYTYQWYRSTSNNFVPQTANLVSGAMGLTLNDTGLSAATTYYYLLVATDAAGSIVWSNQSLATTASGVLMAGTSGSSGITSTGCTVTNTGPSGGTPPYLYQWYRSTTLGFTPGAGNIVTGATSLTLVDGGLTSLSTYYYKMVATDSLSATATSAQLAVTISAPATLTAGSVTTSNVGSTTATILVSTATGGVPPYSYQWYRSTTPGAGNIVSGATSLTLNDTGLTPSTNYYYKNVVTDSVGSTETTAQATITTLAAFSPGIAYVTYVGVKTVQLSATNATGGNGAYTYQWYRSTVSGSSGTALSGATAETLIDTTAVGGTTYYYSLQYKDTFGAAQVLTPQVTAHTLVTTAYEIVGAIGDSIEAGSYSTVQTPFSAMIDQLNFGMPTKEWYGGAQTSGPSDGISLSLDFGVSGTTTLNWLPGGSYLPSAVSIMATTGVTRIICNLGANDADTSNNVSPSTYQSNLSTIIAYLFANISSLKTVHLVGPMFQGETSGTYSVQNCGRLIGYDSAMAALANGTTIFHTNALGPYNYFQRRSSLLQRSADLLHPNDYGDQVAGALWAKCVIDALSITSTTIATTTPTIQSHQLKRARS